jgi:hypothetical protein
MSAARAGAAVVGAIVAAAVAAGASVAAAVAAVVAAGAAVAGALVGLSRLAAVGVAGTRVAAGAAAVGADRGPQAARRLPRLPTAVSFNISRRVSFGAMALLLDTDTGQFHYTTASLEEPEK